MVTITIPQAQVALRDLGWFVTEVDGELFATHPRSRPLSACTRHNAAWGWETLVRAALNVHAGLQ